MNPSFLCSGRRKFFRVYITFFSAECTIGVFLLVMKGLQRKCVEGQKFTDQLKQMFAPSAITGRMRVIKDVHVHSVSSG